MSQKFLFTGTISVGKSTTLEYLRRLNLPDIFFVNEAARNLMGVFPDCVTESGKLGVLPNMGDAIFEEQIRRETEAEKLGAKIILCDRGPLDIITHARVFGSVVKKEWEERVYTYDLIFYFKKEGIPLNRNLYPPGINWEVFRELLDDQTRLFLASCSIPQRELVGTVWQKAEIIRGYFDEPFSTPKRNFTPFKERL